MQRILVPRPEALDVLKEVRTRGYTTGLISDCSADVPEVWAATPLVPFFDVAIFSCIAGVTKPDPLSYHLACAHLGVPAYDCRYVGDGGSHELGGAAAVGMPAALLRVPEETSEETDRAGEEDWLGPTVSTLREVLRWLET